MARTWNKGDPEPEGVTAVLDCDGDHWDRKPSGAWHCVVNDGSGTFEWWARWPELTLDLAPLIEEEE